MVNDLIFRELIKRGYKLEGKTRVWDVADSKLWYLTPNQAQGFLNLSKTKGYKKSIINKEVGLIKKHMQDLVKAFPDKACNIVDLGCGDGEKAALFIGELAKHKHIRYYPIDISSYMVSKAAATIRKMEIGEVLEFRHNISDFENLNNVTNLFRDKIFNNHFMMLLGNTLGNFDGEVILHGTKTSMNKDDILVVGNGLTTGKEKWEEEYKDQVINNWLIQIPKQLGLSEKDVEYEVRFVNSRVEEIYIIKKDKVIKHLGMTVHLKKGDFIIVAISYKYTKNQLKKLLDKFFKKVQIFSDLQESYAIALCKNKK